MFDIRNSGQTVFSLDSDTRTVNIPNDLVVGQLSSNFVFMGDYVISVHDQLGDSQLGIRRRKTDPLTGRYHVPNCLRGFAVNATSIIYNQEFRDASELSLWELRDFMSMVLADDLAYEGITDPFNLATKFTSGGDRCKDDSPLADCVSVRDDIFDAMSSDESTDVEDYFGSLLSLLEDKPRSGDAGYEGSVRTLRVETRTSSPSGYGRTLTNGNKNPGDAGFRFSNAEVEEVFVLEARVVANNFELLPGVVVKNVVGWVGGQLMDFELGSNNALPTGKIVVGPFPETDANDFVGYPENSGDLEPRTPGPVLRFTPGRNTRVYFRRSGLPATASVNINFGGVLPHDQSGLFQAAGGLITANTFVYEFRLDSTGSSVYYNSANVNALMNGPVAVDTGSWEHDREYVLFMNGKEGEATLNGNAFPGTLQRLSGWYKDTMRITESVPAPDGSGDTIVRIADEVRPPLEGVTNECPAHGGPVAGRYGTGCYEEGIHQNPGHNLFSKTLKPGTKISIFEHLDHTGQAASINGEHYVTSEGRNAFRIPKIGNAGTNGGVGGFVSVWRLHKADPSNPRAQNTGASGAYLRFNAGESVLLRLFNGSPNRRNLHLQGHSFLVVSENGFPFDTSVHQTTYSLAPGGTADLLVSANNPNKVNGWLVGTSAAATETVLPTGLILPWQDAPTRPAGGQTMVDYTGRRQGRYAINKDGALTPFTRVAPFCNVDRETIMSTLDSLSYNVDLDNKWGSPFILLSGTASFSFGKLVSTTWSAFSAPDGSDVKIWSADKELTYVSGLTQPGEYLFKFKVAGIHSEDAQRGQNVCEKIVKVTVCPDQTCVEAYNQVSSPAVSLWSNFVTNLRVAMPPADLPQPKAETFDESKKRADETVVEPVPEVDLTKYSSAALGHATLSTKTAKGSIVNTLRLATLDVAEPKVPHNPFAATIGSSYYRWANTGSNADFWFDVEQPSFASTPSFTFAIKRAVYDARVSTFGWILGTDLGNGIAAGAQPPAHHRAAYPLWQGQVSNGNSHDVYFLILSSSDEEFCNDYGCIYTPSLSTSPVAAGNEMTVAAVPGNPPGRNVNIGRRLLSGTFANSRSTDFTFTTQPGSVPVFDPVRDNTGYSPLKYFTYSTAKGTRRVFANMPFVYWGEHDVQSSNNLDLTSRLRNEKKMLLVDRTGCDTYIQGLLPNPPRRSSFNLDVTYNPYVEPQTTDASAFVVSGPPGCQASDSQLNRERGGQLLAVPDFRRMYAIFKLHRAVSNTADHLPYFSLFDTSDFVEAQYHGIAWSPRLSNIVSSPNNPVVNRYRQFGNGVAGTGVYGFQDGVLSTTPGSTGWSPFWHVTNLYWNCGTLQLGVSDVPLTPNAFEDYVIYNVAHRTRGAIWENRNLAFAPDPNDAYFTADANDHYDLIANIKRTLCPGYATLNGASDAGVVYSDQLNDLIVSNKLLETENPAGSSPVGTGAAAIFNAHVPLIFHVKTPVNTFDWVPTWSVDGNNIPKPTILGLYDRPIFQDSWSFFWRRSVNNVLTESLVAVRPLADLDWNKDWSDISYATIPPTTGWEAAELLTGLDATFLKRNSARSTGVTYQDVLTLDTSLLNNEEKRDVTFVLLECSDEAFASQFGAKYVSSLANIPLTAVSSAVYWTQPRLSSTGDITPAAAEAGLASFVFNELPGDITKNDQDPRSSRYSPLKNFMFDNRRVICNMPFISWGVQPGERIVVDNGGCEANIASEPFGIFNLPPNQWTGAGPHLTAGGPPGCDANEHPLHRAGGGQVLKVSNGFVTIKTHRATAQADGVNQYYGIFDSSSFASAAWYGVPASGRLANAFVTGRQPGAPSGYDSLYMWANGVPCASCSLSRFESPIIGANYSPIHSVKHLLWNCYNNTVGPLFTPSNTRKQPFKGVADPYKIRSNLKFEKCADWVADITGGKKVTFNQAAYYQDLGFLYMTGSPAGSELGVEFLNSPIIASVDTEYNQPEDTVASGRTVYLVATNSPHHWYTIGSDNKYFPVGVNASLVAAGRPSVVEVRPGDRVLVMVDISATEVPHGFVLSGSTPLRGSAKLDVEAFFTLIDPPTQKLAYRATTQKRFSDFYGQAAYGYAKSSWYDTYLFAGIVKANPVGTSISFTDYVFGPNEMNGVFRVVSDLTPLA